MKKIAKNILIGSIITVAGAVATQNVVAGLLYHEYKIKTYYEKDDKARKNQDFMVLLHGIYGKSSDMESIAQKFKNDYRIINIQYPTTKETAEEIVELYIKPNIEDINGQIYADNLHRKIENQYYEIDENGKRKEKTNDENAQKNIKINFVAHSMGTGILRYYLKENPLENLGKVVFISPPSHGSHLADVPFVDKFPVMLGKVVPQFSTKKDSFVNQLGEPNYDYMILIGNKTNNPLYSMIIRGKDDGMVPLETAKMESDNFKIINNTTHTSILKDNRTMKEISDFLKSPDIKENDEKKTTRRTNYTTKKTTRTRNIPKHEHPFLEGISCDIYVGKKAGISVRNAIQKAKKSITVISPFLSGNMITEDIFSSLNKDVQVNIISKDNEKIYPFLRKNLFKYHSMPGFGKFILLLGKLILIILYLILSILILEIFTLFLFDVSFIKSIFPIAKANLLALTIFLGLFIFFLRTAIKNNEFYYSLRDNFNIHILSKNYDLHSKIYIIDNKIAFLGSLNFTDTGFMLNHETCIKTTDKTAIKHLNNVYKDLLKVNSISLKELKYKISKKN